MADIAEFIEEIKGMTVLELNSLVKAIEEEFGVSAAAPVAVAGAVAAAAPAEEEKTEFNVVLKEVGGNKISVIKAVTGIDRHFLFDAKNMVEKGGVVKEAAPKDEAEKMVAKLKEAGATAVME